MSRRTYHRPQSAFQSHFSLVPTVHRPRSAFNLKQNIKMDFNLGYIYPFYWQEVNPGDTLKVRTEAMIRFATLLFPLMDNVRFYVHYFFTPNRLVWTHWVNFCGEQQNPGDSIAYTVPTLTSPAVTGYDQQTIFDYFDLPTKVPGYTHITLYLRAYNRIVNRWFRDENLQNALVENTGDSGDAVSDFALQPSRKVKDYFTGSLPSTQKFTTVTLPLGTTAPLIHDPGVSAASYPQWTPVGGGLGDAPLAIPNVNTPNTYWNANAAPLGAASNLNWGSASNPSGLVADLSNASAATINTIRYAFQIQRFLERDMRSGSRYPELNLAHFGVQNPDSRVQWPEYLNGHSDSMYVSVIAQTAPASGGSTPLANLAGMGTAVLKDPGFHKSFVEHGTVIGVIIARADLTYWQGLDRKLSRSVRYDYPWPVLAHLGEQPILNKEIYIQGTANPSADASTFSYQERYAENRYAPNRIRGLFKPNATGTFAAWHLAQTFGGLPTLGSTFIQDSPPTSRVKATSSDPDLIMDMNIHQVLVSTLPTFGVPGYVDHF